MDDPYASRFVAEEQASAYDGLYRARSRDTTIWALQQPLLRAQISGILATRPSARALDFACGTGRILSELVRLVPVVEGTDISPAMAERARSRCPSTPISVGDIRHEGLLMHDSYDLVTAFRFVLNARETARRTVLSRLHALLEPRSGWLILNNHGNSMSLRHLALRARPREADPQNELSDAQMRTLLGESGFRVTSAHGFGILPEVAYRSRLAGLARGIDRVTADRHALRAVTIDRLYIARAM